MQGRRDHLPPARLLGAYRTGHAEHPRGGRLQQIRTAIEYLRENEGNELTGITLMSDGHRIYACSSPGEVMDVLQRGQGVFGIALDRVRDDLEGSLRRGGASDAKAGPTQLSLAATGGR